MNARFLYLCTVLSFLLYAAYSPAGAQTNVSDLTDETPKIEEKPRDVTLPNVYILEVNLKSELAPALKKMERCYQKSFLGLRSNSGEVKVSLKIDKNQRVKNIQITTSPFTKRFHKRCVLPYLRNLTFSEPGLAPAAFHFSIIFQNSREETLE